MSTMDLVYDQTILHQPALPCVLAGLHKVSCGRQARLVRTAESNGITATTVKICCFGVKVEHMIGLLSYSRLRIRSDVNLKIVVITVVPFSALRTKDVFLFTSSL